MATLIGDSHDAHREIAQKLFDRLNGEALQLELTMPVVRMALIHFPAGAPLNPSVVWRNLNEKLELINPANPFQVFHAETSEEDAATLHAIEPASWTAAALAPLPDLADDADRADELAYVRDWWPALVGVYEQAQLSRQIIVCERP